MSSADHILNPLCPVFQVSNFLPEHRTLKQALGSLMFTAMLFLFLFIERKYVLSFSQNGGAHDLVSSPDSGFSIFIISAPKSPRSIVIKGPARILVISKTLTPDSGPLIIDLLSVLKGHKRRPRDYCTRLSLYYSSADTSIS